MWKKHSVNTTCNDLQWRRREEEGEEEAKLDLAGEFGQPAQVQLLILLNGESLSLAWQ